MNPRSIIFFGRKQGNLSPNRPPLPGARDPVPGRAQRAQRATNVPVSGIPAGSAHLEKFNGYGGSGPLPLRGRGGRESRQGRELRMCNRRHDTVTPRAAAAGGKPVSWQGEGRANRCRSASACTGARGGLFPGGGPRAFCCLPFPTKPGESGWLRYWPWRA